MKKANSILFLFTILLFSFSTMLAKDNTFVGSKKCGMCHKKDSGGNQLKIWKASKHANAFKTLQSAEADKIAIEKGFKTKAAETQECLACHTTGHDLDAKMLGKDFKVAEGVQCETCHGAGSGYKSNTVMKSREKSLAKGLIMPDEALCKTCHNDESPHFQGFNFDEYVKKIAHPIPAKD
jgi:hypothetical protein